jgi:hypothetical protein
MATTTTPSSITTIEQLSVNNPSYISDPNDPSENVVDDDVLPPMQFDRQTRPQSSRTTRSTTSRSSVNNLDGRVSCHDYHASKYFSYRVSLITINNIKFTDLFSIYRMKDFKKHFLIFKKDFFLKSTLQMNIEIIL